MSEKRPSLKRPGITATGRQWATIEALRSDGWLILDAEQVAALTESFATDIAIWARVFANQEWTADKPAVLNLAQRLVRVVRGESS